MPRLSTPRILPTLRSRPVPGMCVPGGANTPFMPARALGAPHTTCTGAPFPVSTMHTCSRSAFRCFSAEMTRATVNGASSLALSSTRSTSSPLMVRRSTIASSGACVLRCSLSQPKVNFIMMLIARGGSSVSGREGCSSSLPPCGGGTGRGVQRAERRLLPGSHAPHLPTPASLDHSSAQPSCKRRHLEWAEAVVLEPAHVAFEEGAQVRHPVFQHGDAIDPHAPRKALELVWIDAAVFQHIGMHHPATENLQPILAFAETDAVLVAPALDVDLERRLGEREIRRAEAHLDVIDLEERLAEFLEDPFQVPKVRGSVDHQTLDLMEHRRVGLVGIAP